MKRLTSAELRMRIAVPVMAAALGISAFASKEHIPYILGITSKASAALLYGDYADYAYTVQADAVSEETDKPHIYSYDTYAVDDSEMISHGALGIPSAANEELTVTEPEAIPDEYSDEYTEKSGIITDNFYGVYSGDEYVTLKSGGQIRNLTSLDNSEIYSLSEQSPQIEITFGGEPQVLIMHTHTTECYEPYETGYYDENRSTRTTDAENNMTLIGTMISNELAKKGIGVIHDTTVHDYPSYNGSYDRSRETVKNILEKYPSVKIVLDIHRDAIEREGERIAPVAEIDGKKAAQIMIICGCDDGTMDMPDYTENLKLACFMQSGFERDYPDLARPVLFDYRHYNQDLTTGSLLIEVGGHANTLEQAEYSGTLIGKSLANTLSELKGE
ncbi:MAG: stage II sporulation protein P [Oscillospiraceae bacterium]|nr:stage II sporulation protein P [Oscillospiraceae bacterium]